MTINSRYFVSDPILRPIAEELYASAQDLPLVCPHGHVDPRLFADPEYHFGNPVDLMIQPDHYVLRILHSHGISYSDLGIPSRIGIPVEEDPRKIWQVFADHFYLYNATPTGLWISDELSEVFGIDEPLNSQNAQSIYDSINQALAKADCTPRKLYHRFNIAVLSTTDSPSDDLLAHRQIAADWGGHILPTFRADLIVHIDRSEWLLEIEKLAAASRIEIHDFSSYLEAIESRRRFFKDLGATATDLAVVSPQTADISTSKMEALFQKGLRGKISDAEANQFTAGMLMELARMSAEDGLVMQLHVGSYRNHDRGLLTERGTDLGADFPVPVEFTRPLQPLLNRFGNHPNYHLVLFTLDETAYARELAPLASYYPAVKLGPPWWFHDHLNGMKRFFDQAIDSGGIYNTVGFNDDTRAFLSIPARHDVWRRASANWLSQLVARQIVNKETAHQMMKALACGLALKAYELEKYAPVEARIP
jgi:glucuronate isomerase